MSVKFEHNVFTLILLKMIEFEKFISNLDIENKLGIKDINIDKSVNYRGTLNLIKKENNIDDSKIPPLASAVVGLNNTDAPVPNKPDNYTAWTDIDAQELFLKSKPTCYLILSKPGTGAYSLGEAISQKLNCIHICPRNAIIDEIKQKSPTGKCLDFNMKHNKALKFDDIFPIIKEKLKSPAVSHRGYVMSGLPLVTTSWSEKYLISGLNGEEPILVVDDLLYDIILNLKKKKPKKKKDDSGSLTTSLSSGVGVAEGEEEAEEEVEPEDENFEEEELKIELPKFLLEQCSGKISLRETSMHAKKVILMKQLTQIMDLTMMPDIIIYITCTDKDAVFKKEHTFLNYTSTTNAYEPVPSTIPTHLRWPTKYTLNDSDNRHNNQILNCKYNCKQPMNFKEHSIQQMCNYRNHLLNFIEKKLEEFKPKTIIKLNGCTTVDQMMHQVTERLLLLPIKPVLIPEPMLLEEAPDEMEEFWQLVDQLNVIQSNGVRFNRYASPWFNRCPVELKYRKSTRGNPKFAVALFKHVYIMATLPSMIKFCRNPRPFLELTYLEPTCRTIVIGTKSSGKTMIAQCLSWIFDAPYICYKTFLANEKQKKFDSYAKSILSEIIATIEDKRFNMWQTAESERVFMMDSWYNSTLKCLVNYYPLLVESLLIAEEEENVEDEHEKKWEKVEKPPFDPEFIENFEMFRNTLSFLPFLDDVEQVKLAISDKSILLFHCPAALITPTVKPAIPALGDADVTEAVNDYIISNELQNEIEPTPEELMTEMVKILDEIDTKTADETNNEKIYGKWVIDGFPTESEFWGFLSDFNFMPDYTIALIENRELEPELMQHYKLVENSVKDYEERFLLANDPLIKIKLRTKKPSNTKSLDVQIILNDYQTSVLNFISDEPQHDDTPDLGAEITTFTESIDKVREDWNAIKSKLEEINKCYIEIELENKSDVDVTEEVLLKLRQGYYLPCVPGESDEPEEMTDEDDAPKDLLTFNMPYFVCETNVYCPIAFYNYGVLWEGKPEFSIKYDNKVHFFSKEECLNEIFLKDITKYQSYNKPVKKIPPVRICVVGSIGSGKTTISKYIAKELGLVYVDFAEIVNDYLMPRHFKKVGRKYENSFTSAPADEEGAVELMMDEENQNLEAELLSNENELRRMIDNYFERGSPLLSLLMQKLIKKLWFQKPFSETGFVLDGFPRMPSDVEDMMSCYCIPSLIIEIESSSEIALERLAQKMFKTWKVQLNEAKQKSAKKFNIVKQEWFDFVTKKVVCKLLCEEILDAVIPPEISGKPLSDESVVIDVNLSSILDKNLMDACNDIIQEFPEPVDLSEWEKPDEVLERIEGRIEGIFEVDDENIQNLKEIVSEQRIKSITINNTKPLYKVLRIVLAKLANERDRCGSILEQTFIIASDAAETLLVEASRVPVPDERYDYLCQYHKPASKVPAFLNVVDIAGLVKGAAEGQGLGNAFLSHIKACDAIFHLCRAFDDEDVIHVDGEVNPVRDLETIGEELRLKDEEQLMAALDKLERNVNRGADKKLKPEYDALLKIKAHLVDEKKHIRFGDWSAADIEIMNRYLFITSKPALYLVNLSEKDYIRKKNKWLPKLKEWIDKNDPGAFLVPFSGVLESKLMDMDPEEKQAFLKEHGITSALDKIIVQGYKALQLEYFFTAGADEVKAWIIQKGTKAPQAAGRIHTDFEKGFIMAEVMHYKDFKEEGSEAACKSAGKYRQQGRNYVVEDGDIIFFKFNAGAGIKDAKKK